MTQSKSPLPSQPTPRLVLASGSPRRRHMLEELGFDFDVRPAAVDEAVEPGEGATTYVLRLAKAKARRVSANYEDDLVLAADTVVTVDGELLGKPTDPGDAGRMLAMLSGREHEVLTAIAVRARALELTHVERTRVRFAHLSTAEIAWYVDTGEPMDKAGAYGIQGLGALFVERIDGNYASVVGLPLPATYRLLRQAGYPVLSVTRPGIEPRPV
ncbi:MAG: Maf family protein [Acidobacteriota bacterium]